MKTARTATGTLCILLLFTAGGQLGAYRTPLSGGKLPDFPETIHVRRSQFSVITAPVPPGRRPPASGEEVFTEPGEQRQVKFVTARGEPWDDWGNIRTGRREEAEDNRAPGSGDVLRYIFHFGENMRFSTPTAGSYIIERDPQSGELSRVIVYLKSARGYAAVLEPHQQVAGESRMDLYLCGRRLQEGISVPLPLKRIVRISFDELMHITSGYVDWDFVLRKPAFPGMERIGDAVSQVRPYLSALRVADDGAMDRQGRYVHIRDGSPQEGEGGLNCSGFAKWVVDGFYYTRREELLPIAPLKKKHLETRGNRWSEKYEDQDPYFGLDWSRNLAVRMMELKWNSELSPEAADVDRLEYHLYREDVGFPVTELRTVLYELAANYPESFYLGSVNKLTHEEGQLRRHFHVAVFFPWLDEEGVLQTAVMESTEETALTDFITENRDYYIHLVRIELPGAFSPPGEEIDPSLKR